jgi:hypothetical protein
MKKSFFKVDTYRSGNAWFTCDRCSQRWRRSEMITEWTGLKVCSACLDPPPPQMMPPNIYPEGIPFIDARPPQDNPDRLTDDTYLTSITGGMGITNGQIPVNAVPGALSPQDVLSQPIAQGPEVLQDDITIITGVVTAPSVEE